MFFSGDTFVTSSVNALDLSLMEVSEIKEVDKLCILDVNFMDTFDFVRDTRPLSSSSECPQELQSCIEKFGLYSTHMDFEDSEIDFAIFISDSVTFLPFFTKRLRRE